MGMLWDGRIDGSFTDSKGNLYVGYTIGSYDQKFIGTLTCEDLRFTPPLIYKDILYTLITKTTRINNNQPETPPLPPPPPPPPPLPPRPNPPPIICNVSTSVTTFLPFNTTDSKINLKAAILSSFYYEPDIKLPAIGTHYTGRDMTTHSTYNCELRNNAWYAWTTDTLSYGDVASKDEYTSSPLDYMARNNGYRYSRYTTEIVSSVIWHGWGTIGVCTYVDTFKLTANLSQVNTKVRFNLFTDISVTRTSSSTLDPVNTSITKKLYPYSIFLKSITVMPDAYNKNGYTSVSLINPILLNRKVYSVNIEGNPTDCNSGFVLDIQQIMNNAYYPNMMLEFNFVDYIGNEFTYYCDDPLVEIDAYDYIKPLKGGGEAGGGVGMRIPKFNGSIDYIPNYLSSLSYIRHPFGVIGPVRDINSSFSWADINSGYGWIIDVMPT